MTSSTAASPRRRALKETLIVVIPLGVATILNGAIRPLLASTVDATQIRSGAAVRGSDRWWEVDPGIASDHPVLTDFLRFSDGAIGMIALGCCAAIAITLWIRGRIRSRRYAKSA